MPVTAQDLAANKLQAVNGCAKLGIELRLDQPYAGNASPRQQVDLYLPKQQLDNKPLPVIVWIHGGGWKSGDRLQQSQLVQFLMRGADGSALGRYAGVSIGYRLTDEARWPSQIHDCKAAIRWIRGHAKELGLDPDRIGVVGASAGGHLASLLGTSGDVKELEGTLGEFTTLSSRVTCVVNLCGPQDFTKGLMLDRSGQPVPNDPLVVGLLGGTITEQHAAAVAASPVTWVSTDDPPFLTIHGTADAVVHFTSHAKSIHVALQQKQVSSSLITVIGGDHGSPAKTEPLQRILPFLDKHLRGLDTKIDLTLIQAKP
ncbi:alpha/beta hydrolase fold domain-containing protein [bacterium]|nr:alpha/beta hydrolase fold domain-containing protein [bacterium]